MASLLEAAKVQLFHKSGGLKTPSSTSILEKMICGKVAVGGMQVGTQVGRNVVTSVGWEWRDEEGRRMSASNCVQPGSVSTEDRDQVAAHICSPSGPMLQLFYILQLCVCA